jgi:hypothetical protein
MKAISIVHALLLTAVAIGCSDGSRKAGVSQGKATDQAAARRDVIDRFGKYGDTICVAKRAGHDYLRTVSDCLLRDEQAMHELFVMTAKAGFDAASGEGHSDVLVYVLRDTGDRFFGRLLALESDSVQAAVRHELRHELGYDDTRSAADSVRYLYAKTFAGSGKL